jgi:heme exporter protein D
MATFLNMGGYALFVWPSYIVSIAVLVFLGVSAYRFLRTQEAALREMEESLSGKGEK